MKPNDKMKTIGKRLGVDFGKDNDTEVYDFLVKKGFAGLANMFFDDTKPKPAVHEELKSFLAVQLSGYLSHEVLQYYLKRVKKHRIKRLSISYFVRGKLGRQTIDLWFEYKKL